MSALGVMFAYFWHAERKWFLAGAAASAATVLAGLALLGLSGWFITACALAGSAGVGLSFDFFRPSAGIRLLALARTSGRYAERLITHDATLRFLGALRVDLLRGLARRSRRQQAAMRSAQMLERLTGDVDALDNLYLRMALPLIVLVVTAVALTAAMLAFSASLAGVIAALLLTATGTVFFIGMLARKDARRRGFALEALRVRTIDLMRANTELAMVGTMALQQAKALDAGRRLAVANQRLHVSQLMCDGLLSLLGAGCVAGVLLLAAPLVETGDMTAPQLALLVLATFAALECLGALRRGAHDFGRTALAARRILPILHPERPATGQTGVKASAAKAPPVIRFRDVEHRAAAQSAPMVRRITVSIEAGEHVAIMGPSGSGKSTLLALAAGMLQPTEGQVAVYDRPPELGSRTVGFLTQRTELLRDTIANNLRLAVPSAPTSALWSALSVVELASTVQALPQGLDTALGEGGAGLSGGQQRRLALARIVLLKPSLWLLDEPTAGMDKELARRVMHNIAVVAEGASILIACHQGRERVVASRTLHMRDGTIDFNQGGNTQRRAF